MTYRLQSAEPLDAGVRRVVRELNEKAETALSARRNRQEAVYEARKCFKKIRAVLRLVRTELGEATYRAENEFYRDLGRQLSEVRDAQAMLELVEGFQTDAVPRAEWRRWCQQLRRQRNNLHRRVLTRQQLARVIQEALRQGRERIDTWPLRADRAAAVPNVARVYRQGYRQFGDARATLSVEALHNWRKRVKYYWQHLKLLRESWPTVLSATALEVHRLAGLLGTDHDLAVMEEKVRDQQLRLPHREAEQALLDRLATQRATLQQKAFRLAEKLYAEPPEAFAKRLTAYV